jgi:hypothetical protein
MLKATVCFSVELAHEERECEKGGVVKTQDQARLTVLLLIEILDAIARIVVLTETCLVLFSVELGCIIPQLQLLDIHCEKVRLFSQTSLPLARSRCVPTFIDSVRDVVKSATIALLGDGLGAGEGRHCK